MGRFSAIGYEPHAGAGLITYRRPERRNALSVGMYREIVEAVEAANADPNVRAIVITNEGPVFSAGVDLKAPPEPKDPETGHRPNLGSLSMAEDASWLHLMARSKPVIGAINGPAIGAGATHALAMDIRLASDDASFAFPFVRIGYLPEIGCTGLLPRLIGHGRALALCLSGGSLSAAEALACGLVSGVFPKTNLLPAALDLAGRLSTYDPHALRLTKALITENGAESDVNALLGRERDAFAALYRARRAAPAGAG